MKYATDPGIPLLVAALATALVCGALVYFPIDQRSGRGPVFSLPAGILSATLVGWIWRRRKR